MIGLHYAVVLPLLGGLLVALALLLDIAGKPHATKVLRYGLLSLLVGWIIYIIPFITLDYTLAEVARNANDDLSFALRLASSWAGGGNSLYLYTVFLAATILNGRPGTPMPPWRPFLSRTDVDWILDRLLGADRP